jgi:DnaJ family protein A protein 2
MSKLYETLELEKNASSDEIKKAYRNLAKIHHPDKGGDPEIFKKISYANEILSNQETRSQYDQLGDKNFENRNNSQQQYSNPFDILSQMFGGFGFNNNPVNKTRQSRYHFLKISLKEAFDGISKKMRLKTEDNCSNCSKDCNDCKGSGNITQTIQNGPFIQMINKTCNKCLGEGVLSSAGKDSCEICHGSGVNKTVKEIIINILPGVQERTGITITENSIDFVFEIQIENHPLFTRNGNNLIYYHTLSFIESICGTSFTIQGLDGDFTVDTSNFGIIFTGYRHTIKEKGMISNSYRGDMIIEFRIEYPIGPLSRSYKDKLIEVLK